MDHPGSPPRFDAEQDAGHKPRRVVRQSVDQPASLCPHNWYNIEVRLRNVSPCGFMVECSQPVRIGSYLVLDLPGIGAVQAQIRWQVGSRIGGMFLDPVGLDRCEWYGEKAEPTSPDRRTA